jgi:hypothetical protein
VTLRRRIRDGVLSFIKISQFPACKSGAARVRVSEIRYINELQH